MMVPDVFIVGATKCATSSLHYQLGFSGHISMSNPKEPRFLEDGLSIETAIEKYKDVFGTKDIRIEANPNHFVIGYVPGKIKLVNPNAKIIIMIREPVDRLISHVNYFRGMRPGRERQMLSFEQLDLYRFDYEEDYVPYMCPEWGNYKRMYVETGCYVHYIPRFAKLFDTKVIVYEEYIKDPQSEVDQIADWLEIDRFKIKDDRIRNKGKTKDWSPTKSGILGLREFYRSYNDQLFTKLGRELWNY